jgi:hypothetical protein
MAPAELAEEDKRRLRLLRASIEETRGRVDANRWMSGEHVGAFVAGIDDLVGRAEAASPQALITAERAWSFFGMIQGQHRDPELGPWLQVADRCVQDGYEVLRRGCEALGVTSSLPPPPVTFAEAIRSPVVYARSAKVRVPGLVSDAILELPLPVVVYPPNQLQSLWLYSTLHHEVGHNFDRALGLSAELQRAIETGLDQRRDEWCSWTREILADAVGVGLGGEGFAYTLAEVLASLSLMAVSSLDGAHPPAVVRLVLVASMLDGLAALGSGRAESITATTAQLRQLAETSLANLPELKDLRAYVDDARVVARLVLSSNLSALGERPLAATLPDVVADSTTAHAMAALLRLDAVAREAALQTSAPPNSWRLLPSAARLAVRAIPGATEAALDELQRAGDALRGKMSAPDWVIEPTRWRTLRSLIPQLDRSIYEEEATGYKRPPHRLLCEYERIAFVAATNDQLADRLRKAFAARSSRRWASLELFFLDDAELAAIAAGEGTTPRALVAAKANALEELSKLVPDVAERWAFYTYARPYYFASYWDHEEQGGRIHVSPFIWGQPVKKCPGLDYLWHRDRREPTREYRAYAAGLAGLRGASGTTMFRSSDARGR